MIANDRKSILIVEDESDWRDIYIDDCTRRGWKITAFDNVSAALHEIESGDHIFDAAIVDKGDNEVVRRGPEIIGYRDGLTVLRRLKELQPTCIRILATGESWSHSLFTDPSLRLHVFLDKGFYVEFGQPMCQIIQEGHLHHIPENTIVFSPTGRGAERSV